MASILPLEDRAFIRAGNHLGIAGEITAFDLEKENRLWNFETGLLLIAEHRVLA